MWSVCLPRGRRNQDGDSGHGKEHGVQMPVCEGVRQCRKTVNSDAFSQFGKVTSDRKYH